MDFSVGREPLDALVHEPSGKNLSICYLRGMDERY